MSFPMVLRSLASRFYRSFTFNHSHFTKFFQEEFWALKDVSFEINKRDRVGIIGRNGAGKINVVGFIDGKKTTGEYASPIPRVVRPILNWTLKKNRWIKYRGQSNESYYSRRRIGNTASEEREDFIRGKKFLSLEWKWNKATQQCLAVIPLRRTFWLSVVPLTPLPIVSLIVCNRHDNKQC